MFETFEPHINSSSSALGNTSNPLDDNTINPFTKDFTGLSSQQLLALAGESLIDAYQYQASPTQALIYTAASIFNTNFAANAQIAFGETFDVSKAETLGAGILSGNFGVSLDVQFLSNTEINGAFGAFAKNTDTIYLNSVFLTQNADNPTAIGKVLVEEVGHFLDAHASLIDSPGDEGEILADLVSGKILNQGELIPLKAEDDSSVLTINGQSVFVEFSTVNLALNQTFNGQLSTSDSSNPTRTATYSDDYRLTGLTSGQQVRLDMTSSFDTYLQLINESTGQIIDYNDDYNGTINSQINFTVQSGISYIARATSFSTGVTGSYNISANSLSSAVNLALNQTLNGELTTSDSSNPTRTGTYSDDYRLTGLTSGQQVRLDMTSSFDTYLQLINESTGQIIDYNDDSNGTVNSQINFTAQSGISYIARATSFNTGVTGSYNISTNSVSSVVNLVLNQSLNGELTTSDRSNPTRTSTYSDDYRLTGLTSGQQVRLDMTSSFDTYLQLINESTGQIIDYNDDSNGTANSQINFTAQSGISYIARATSYNTGVTGSYNISANSAIVNVSNGNWKAEFFNGRDFTGTPILVQDWGSSSQNISRNWGDSSPGIGINSDNFSARVTTERYLNAGTYKVTTNVDDGIRVTVGGRKVIEQWIDQGAGNTHSGYFYWGGGNVPILAEYYENAGAASIQVQINSYTAPQAPSINEGINWKASVYTWDLNQGNTPPVNFEDDSKLIGLVDLGSNTQNGVKGINVDWQNGAIKGEGNWLPHDQYAIRAYTQTSFDDGAYKFRVRADDAYQLLAKRWDGSWFDITRDTWGLPTEWKQDAYGAYREYTATLAAGNYDMHFQYFEGGGSANFNLSWEKVAPISNPDINIQIGYPEGDLVANGQNRNWILQRAEQIWENIITSAPFSGGVLKLAVTQDIYNLESNKDNSLYNRSWRESNDQRISSLRNGNVWAVTTADQVDFEGRGINSVLTIDGLGGIDYNAWTQFDSSKLLNISNSDSDNYFLLRLAVHEIGHALGLNESENDPTLNGSIMNLNLTEPYITTGLLDRLRYLGYGVNNLAPTIIQL